MLETIVFVMPLNDPRCSFIVLFLNNTILHEKGWFPTILFVHNNNAHLYSTLFIAKPVVHLRISRYSLCFNFRHLEIITDWLTYWLINSLIDWLIDGWMDGWMDWLTDWLKERLIDWLIFRRICSRVKGSTIQTWRVSLK